ncbi:hypothetical protein FRB96_001359 [Tulasnella sp. 330]|nr:hypothetical protein FRB96_001359 [Tulasnella sp. 330]
MAKYPALAGNLTLQSFNQLSPEDKRSFMADVGRSTNAQNSAEFRSFFSAEFRLPLIKPANASRPLHGLDFKDTKPFALYAQPEQFSGGAF